MRIAWLLAVMALCALCANANDASVVGESGRVRLMKGEHPTVRMVREWVKMDIYPKYYDVSVQFVFRNDGPATTVQMGFPESGGGDGVGSNYYRHTGFERFRTWVDGKEVKAERLPVTDQDESSDYRTYWVKTVTFARNQTRSVRVEYRSPLHDSVMGDRGASYNFTGGNWAGVVEESTLRVTLHLSGAYLVETGIPMSLKENQLAYRWTNWQAETGFSLSFVPIRTDAMTVSGVSAMPFNYFSEYGRVIVLPGKSLTPVCVPPAILKDKIVFLNLSALAESLRQRAQDAKRPKEDYPTLTWDAAASEATLVVGQKTIRFGLKRPVMQVNEREVPLPAGPFLSTPVEVFGVRTSNLFVPLQPLVEALGGTVTNIKLAERRVEVTIPGWWEEGDGADHGR